MSQILVVSNDGARLADMLDVLSTAGYQASGAATFQEATDLLAYRAPDVVIADERLGAFNGLHVILRARAARPDVGGIVTTPVKRQGLEADARRLRVACMIKPQNPAEWATVVSRVLRANWLEESVTPSGGSGRDLN